MNKKIVLLHAFVVSKKGEMDQWGWKAKILLVGLGALIATVVKGLEGVTTDLNTFLKAK